MAINRDTLYYAHARVYEWIEKELNFFRLHLIYFTIVPLIAAGIFYAANGEFHIREYFDLLSREDSVGLAIGGAW